MEAIGIGVAIVVLSTVIIGVGKWLMDEENRQTVKQRFCRHQWKPIDDGLISPYRDWCVKCDARR